MSDQVLPHRSDYLALERAASRSYLEFVYGDPGEADRIREGLFDARACEFGPEFGRVLLDRHGMVGMISCLRAEEVTRVRMRAAMCLARAGWLAKSSETWARMELAGRTLIKLQPGDYYLSRIAVRHEPRAPGASDEMMRFCIGQAEQSGSSRICLEVAKGNDRAIRFYQRWSFAEVAVRSVEAADRSLTYAHLVRPLR
jgi:ribosomal protein S18 acetylase RimI-like enzyme